MEGLKMFVNSTDAKMDSSSHKGSQNSTSSATSSGTLNGSLFSQAGAVSQRIVTVEYYMSPPVKEFDNLYSEFRNSSVNKVPVVRIFGTTSAGQKMCANIHGVYPYISILDDDTVTGFEYRIASALDDAINDTVNTNKFRKGDQSHKRAATQHVFKVIRVVGKTFYGYRSRNQVFLRIFFYNPLMIRKAVDLLHSGSVLGRRFQPYESHIPYSLQFMIDYCLYGMNYIHYAAVKFRRNLKGAYSRQTEDEDMMALSQNSNTSHSSLFGYVDPDRIEESLLGPPQLSKLTLCELEVDVLASDIILAAKASAKTVSVNPGIDCIWKDEMERRRLRGIDDCSQITIPESQERPLDLPMHPAELKHMESLWNKLDSLTEDDNINGEQESALFIDDSLLEESEVIPSSQLMDHLPGDDRENGDVEIHNQLSQEQDEFMKLLEEMAEGEASLELKKAHELAEDPFGNLLCENPQGDFPEDCDGGDEEENLWDDSFLNASILEKLSEAESMYEQAESHPSTTTGAPSSQSSDIFQCDGQGGDSDSSLDVAVPTSSKKKNNYKEKDTLPVPTRKSGRMSELKVESSTKSESKSNAVELPFISGRKSRHSKTLIHSPVDRLSLTLRRKSRSQDPIKAKPQALPVSNDEAMKPGPSNPKRKSVHFKRRSMSVDEGANKQTKQDIQFAEVKKLSNEEIEKTGNVSKPSPFLTNQAEKLGCPKLNKPSKKAKDSKEVGKSNIKTTQPKIMEKIPLVYLTKIDVDTTLTSAVGKRARRKPRRFVDQDDMDTCSISSKDSNLTPEQRHDEEMVENKAIEGIVSTTAVGKSMKRKQKTRKASVEEVESDIEQVSNTRDKKETMEDAKKQKVKNQSNPVGLSISTRGKSAERDKETRQENVDVDSKKRGSNEESQQLQPDTNKKSLAAREKKGKLKKMAATESLPITKNVVNESHVNITEDDNSKKELNKSGRKISRSNDKAFQLEGIIDAKITTKTRQSPRKTIAIHETKSEDNSNKKISDEAKNQKPVLFLSPTKDQINFNQKKKKLGLALSRNFGLKRVSTSNPDATNSSIKPAKPDSNKSVSISIVDDTVNDLKSHGKNEEVIVKDIKEEKTFSEIGISCQPVVKTSIIQTDRTVTRNAFVSAQPQMKDKESQIKVSTTSIETQTEKKMVSIETQTDAVAPLCLCQCTCVVKEKTSIGVDNQDDLKPIMESKRIQVDNVDMITRARSARFTTPQSCKTKRITPSKSPEKRRPNDSPSRRSILNTTPTPSHSRYLSALAMKTPTSTHKYRNFRASSSTPSTDSPSYHEEPNNDTTPPLSPRESREGYLINSIRTASSSPRKRSGFIKPRNLDIEVNNRISSNVEAVKNSTCVPFAQPSENPDPLHSVVSIEDEMLGAMECDPGSSSSSYEDLSVNSIYEYEEDEQQKSPAVSPWPLAQPSTDESEEEASPASLSSFQKKRIMSKHRTKNRLEKRRAANLDANRGIPDVFEFEFEPLKQPPTYKSTDKWLESEKTRLFNARETESHSPNEMKHITGLNGESSDEELPPPVKLFGGGNMSDDDNSDSSDTPRNRVLSVNGNADIKPFTPPIVVNCTTPIISIHGSQNSDSCHSGTPRSILRQSGISRRHNARVSKRKITWGGDETESYKRRKGDDDDERSYMKREINDDDDSQNIFNNGSLNKTADTSELDGVSFQNALGLENSMSNFQDVKALHQCQFLTTMCVEVHCASRNGLIPDPAIDSIYAIFVLVSNDYPTGFGKPKENLRLLLLDDASKESTTNYSHDGTQSTRAYSSESDLISAFVSLVRFWDPDIFVGYEIEKSSFGYLIQRAQHLGKDLTQELSRVVPVVRKEGDRNVFYGEREEWNGTISGRIVLNLWRLLRHEITVNSYTFENAAYHILLRRVFKFSHKTLSMYWSHKMHRNKVIQYYTIRVKGCIQIMDKLDLINRTSELARLFGIQFYEVLSRGSQFRVESMMLRATKPLDYIAPSPGVMQRSKMRAPEYLPLILEPRSNYYTDPVAVLDFQSLYPSMMIAYNYDYASVLGRVESLTTMDHFPLGCLEHIVPAADLLRLKNKIHVSPAGIAFVDKSVVRGVVPEMLEQILDTRQMVKRSMKKWKDDGASLRKVLDSRQLGLKLIANVTYGYTSANFSGRMPCIEIADSIVSKGRETLQRAITHVKENFHRWGAEVVYGDTDSLFILFRGKSKDEAFKMAYEIADEVTQANPKPVKLKFEKIYQPCILQSKKRYVGYAYETPDQVKPIYDAKGIETVRRDGCPAVKKILEKTLHVLFSSNKPKKVEEYVKSQFEKLFKGRVSMQDYIFARKYRGRAGYKPTACVPALEIAKKLSAHDPRAEPLSAERVPYVVIYGNPSLPLIKLVRTPDEYLENPAMRLNAHYYIEKAIIPALKRCLALAGIDVMKWYLQLPRKYLRNVLDQKAKGQGTLDDYILHQNCLRCDGKAEQGLCKTCLSDERASVIYLQEVVRNAKSKLNACVEICSNCAGDVGTCVSLDCPVLHKLTRYQRDQAYMKNVESELVKLDLDW